ncbi:hypothetical protein AMS68_006648 [Peltaster fructicola]|uniref:Uncharacterized protein n=1 Tax=Peltaster fructicola TaxID=286661 RepID=A0A6H0Y2J0_9PEZI|nr:hypothetical protein AMS68_006648 [Peltaster fructicola]
MPRLPRGQASTRGEQENTLVIPVGEFATVEHRDPNQSYDDYPAISSILLAQIYEDATDKDTWIPAIDKRVWFWRMRAWHCNNKTIGYADMADGCEGKKLRWNDPRQITLDPWLKSCEKNADAIRVAIVAGFRRSKTTSGGATGRFRPRAMPEEPVDQVGVFSNHRSSRNRRPDAGEDGSEEIDVIAQVKVDIEKTGQLGSVDLLVLAAFELTESLDEIKTFFLDACEWKSSNPRKSERKVGLKSLLPHDDYDLEIWVLPQERNNLKMYNWGLSPRLRVWDFTEHNHPEDTRYAPLYVEARVVPKKQSRPGQPSKATEKTSKRARDEPADEDNASDNGQDSTWRVDVRTSRGSAARQPAATSRRQHASTQRHVEQPSTSGRRRSGMASAPRQRGVARPVAKPRQTGVTNLSGRQQTSVHQRDASPVRSDAGESTDDGDEEDVS